jgi:hypothetical protein
MFGTILLSICTIMHLYVLIRAASVPLIRRYIPVKHLTVTGFLLWLMLVGGRVIGHKGVGILAETLEFCGMTWMSFLFLTFIILFTIDLFTCFGFLLPGLSKKLRGFGLILGIILSFIAFIQGSRLPVVHDYTLSMPGLPESLDGTVLVALSDMHINSHTKLMWLDKRIRIVQRLKADIIVLLGDIVEGHSPPSASLIKCLSQLSAPLNVWAVYGNHEYYGGHGKKLLKSTGFNILNNRSEEILPGFVIAGVDDLTVSHRQGGNGKTISTALKGRPAGSTVFLSHSPLFAEKAAAAGADLMLSGHTHGGQIWPFNYLVRLRYPLLEGLYNIEGMHVIVSRGTGTWGPRMRLWRRGEILKITLKCVTD